MSKVVYHFTTSMPLPWIVSNKALCPMPATDVGIGYSKLIWATAKRTGEKTSTAKFMLQALKRAWQADMFRIIRFTISAEHFDTWAETVRREGWTEREEFLLRRDDMWRRFEAGHDLWHCRPTPLPLGNVRNVEVRACGDRWRRLELNPDCVVPAKKKPGRMGYRFPDGKILFADREADVIPMNPRDPKDAERDLEWFFYVPADLDKLPPEPKKKLTRQQKEEAEIEAFQERRAQELEDYEESGEDPRWE
jgi:hypothetical protein